MGDPNPDRRDFPTKFRNFGNGISYNLSSPSAERLRTKRRQARREGSPPRKRWVSVKTKLSASGATQKE